MLYEHAMLQIVHPSHQSCQVTNKLNHKNQNKFTRSAHERSCFELTKLVGLHNTIEK